MSKSSVATYDFNTDRLADLPVEIVRFEELPAIASTNHARRHNFYELIWITSGAGTQHIDFEAFPVTQYSLCFITPGQLHFWEVAQQLTGYAILFVDDFMIAHGADKMSLYGTGFYQQWLHYSVLHIQERAASEFTILCEQMLAEYKAQHYGRFTMIQCLLTMLLLQAYRHNMDRHEADPVVTTDDLLTKYLYLIDTQFYEIKQVTEYARLLNVSPGHLRDIVRQQLDTTPIQLLNRRILLEAKRLLMHTTKSITAIAYDLTFDNPSYFSRFFKRESGMSPSEFRQYICEKYQVSSD